MNRDLFISYSRNDYDDVVSIVNLLHESTGVDCWIDLKGIESGSEQFIKDIIEGIDNCKVFLFMLSVSSQQSEYALNELNYAKVKGKRVVLVNINGCQMNETFLFQYGLADIIAWDSPLQREKLIRDIIKWTSSNSTIPSSYTTKQLSNRSHRSYPQLFAVENNHKFGFADIDGNVIIPYDWKKAKDFSEGLGGVADSNGKWGFVDESGQVVISCRWTDCGQFSEGFAAVNSSLSKKSPRYGFIDRSGNLICENMWLNYAPFHNGYAAVMNNRYKYGFINDKGDLVVPCVWSKVMDFNEGLAPVQYGDGKWGFINTEGTLVIPCKWKRVRSFVNGLARVQNAIFLWKTIDRTGRIVK